MIKILSNGYALEARVDENNDLILGVINLCHKESVSFLKEAVSKVAPNYLKTAVNKKMLQSVLNDVEKELIKEGKID